MTSQEKIFSKSLNYRYVLLFVIIFLLQRIVVVWSCLYSHNLTEHILIVIV